MVMRCCSKDLLQSLAGQVCLRHGQPIALRGKVPHLAVGGPVMQCNGGQVVECLVQVVSHTGCESEKRKRVKSTQTVPAGGSSAQFTIKNN